MKFSRLVFSFWGSLAASVLCGFVAALPFRDLLTSLPAWFIFAPVYLIVARAKTKRAAALYAYVFALVWTSYSFTFMWANAFDGAVAAAIYTSLIYMLALLCVRRIARIAPRLQPGATIGLIQGNIKTKLGRTADMLTEQTHLHLELHRKVIAEIIAAEQRRSHRASEACVEERD